MDQAKRERLEARGYGVFDTVEEFLGLEPYEGAIVDMRVRISLGIREARERAGMTQAQLGKAMGSGQGRVAKAEAGSEEVSVELMLRALYAAGGTLTGIGFPGPPGEAERLVGASPEVPAPRQRAGGRSRAKAAKVEG